MNRIVELSGLIGVKDEKVFAYLSIEPEKVRKALEIEIACTGADDNGAYNIYFDDEENICCLQEGDLFIYKGVMYEIVHKDKWETYCKYVNNKSRLGWFSSEYLYCKFSNYTKVEI